MSVESDYVHRVGLCTLVDAIGEHQTRWDKASEDMIHKSTVETDDRQMQGRANDLKKEEQTLYKGRANALQGKSKRSTREEQMFYKEELTTYKEEL